MTEQTKATEETKTTEPTPQLPINLTDRAVLEVRKVMEEQELNPADYVLEAGVAGGGCSGFTYKLGFKERKDIDKLNETLVAFGDLEVAIHNRALLYLEGTTIDFHEGLEKRGFVFANPNSKSCCGCGNSFSA